MEKKRFRAVRKSDQQEIYMTENEILTLMSDSKSPQYQLESIKDDVEEFFRQIHNDYINSFKRLMKKRKCIQSDLKIWVDGKLQKYSQTMKRTDMESYILKIRFLTTRAAAQKSYTDILETQLNQFIEDVRMHLFLSNHDSLNLLTHLYIAYRVVKLAAGNSKDILYRSDYYKRLLKSKFHEKVVRTSTVDGCIDKLNQHKCNSKVILMGYLKLMETDLEGQQYNNIAVHQLNAVQELKDQDSEAVYANLLEPYAPLRTAKEIAANSVDRMSVDELVNFIEGDRPTKNSRKRRRNKKKQDEDEALSTQASSSSPPEPGPVEIAQTSKKVNNEIDDEVEEFRKRLEFTPFKEEKLKANISKEWVTTLRTKLKSARTNLKMEQRRSRNIIQLDPIDRNNGQISQRNSSMALPKIKKPGWHDEMKYRRPHGWAVPTKPVTHNVEREIIETRRLSIIQMQQLKQLLRNLYTKNPKKYLKQKTKDSSTVQDSPSSSVFQTFDTLNTNNSGLFDIDETETFITNEWASWETLDLKKKKKGIKKRRGSQLPKISSMGKSLYQPRSLEVSPRLNGSFHKPYLGTSLDKIVEKPSSKIHLQPHHKKIKNKTTPLSIDPYYKYQRSLNQSSSQRFETRQNNLDQMNQIVNEIFELEADKNAKDSFDNFIRHSQSNNKHKQELEHKIDDVMQMIRYADEKNPDSFETFLDTKVMNRKIESKLFRQDNVNQMMEEGRDVSGFVNLMTLNEKRKKLWRRV